MSAESDSAARPGRGQCGRGGAGPFHVFPTGCFGNHAVRHTRFRQRRHEHGGDRRT